MKIVELRIRGVAGYTSLTWRTIQPRLNLLVGRNGAGKTTVLQAIALGLSHLRGERSEDLLRRTNPDAEIALTFDSDDEPARVRFSSVPTRPRPWPAPSPLELLQIVENRQPKNTVGEVRSEPSQADLLRYHNAVSELKRRLNLGGQQAALARKVLERCHQIAAAGDPEQWRWIEGCLLARRSRQGRPMSCGQFDLVALLLDFARLEETIGTTGVPAFVILDNPETYLHPACLEPLLEALQEMLPETQVFLSSHSLKVLCHRDPRSVFWLSRDRQYAADEAEIRCVRDLEEGSQSAFFELYGDDVSSAVLSLLRSFESPEYYKWLCDCALPSTPDSRPDPARDRQLLAVRAHLDGLTSHVVILDYGAGHGDLVEALLRWAVPSHDLTYVALVPEASPLLTERVTRARALHMIGESSQVIQRLDDAPRNCDRIILCNVCHEILPPDLPDLLARLLRDHLRPGGRIIIHEVETLSVGERAFVMWLPEDYEAVFSGIDAVRMTPHVDAVPGRVPLNTTLIELGEEALPDELDILLRQRFASRLSIRKRRCLEELAAIWGLPVELRSLRTALRQRRAAFLIAQIAAIDVLETPWRGSIASRAEA